MKEIINLIIDYHNRRPVIREHDTPENLVDLLRGEADEVARELASWKGDPTPKQVKALGEELADVFIYTALMADLFGIELAPAILEKLGKNEIRFPEHLFDGSTPGTFREIYLRRKKELGER